MDQFTLEKLGQLKYCVLPGRCPPNSTNIDLHNRVYEKWAGFWSNVYAEADSLDAFTKDDFFRQDCIPVIMYKDEIVAIHCYTFFNLNQKSAIENHYFDFFNDEYFRSLKSTCTNYVMSMEFLTVNSDWRKRNVHISVGDLLVGTGLELMKESSAQAAVAPARADVKANEIAYRFNFSCVVKDVVCRNFKCDLVAGFKEKVTSHKDPFMRELIARLWANRRDYRNIDSRLPIKAA